MLETQRLFLKPFIEKDFTEISSLFQDKDFMAFSPNGALTTEAAAARFWEIEKHYTMYGYAKMAMVLKTTQQIIGYCGFEKCVLNGNETVELGFRIIQRERQKGYIKEAAIKLCEDIQMRGFKSVIAFSELNNFPAHQLLLKLGFIEKQSAHFLNMDVIFFEKVYLKE
jgi:[ribosomal protein S5]-alanine N-acetyltransferase